MIPQWVGRSVGKEFQNTAIISKTRRLDTTEKSYSLPFATRETQLANDKGKFNTTDQGPIAVDFNLLPIRLTHLISI